jgi:glycerol-3-phosphate dehydrogenase
VADIGHDHALRLVKGSHIVVPKLFDHRYAYIFQQPDRRIVFAIPYEREFTLIGTTDVEYHGDPSQPRIDADETTYLCEAANRYFRKELAPSDVVWSYSGVRPLLDDENTSASEVTRDYLLEVDADGPPLLNVFGGKITTFRKLAEEAVDQLAPLLGSSVGAWTATGRHLPGGGEPDIDELLVDVRADRPWLNDAMADRLVRTYGTRCRDFLGAAASLADLGEHFGGDLYAAEVDYLVRHEWARQAEDILWRRTKTGLHVDAAGAARLDAYISTRLAAKR